MRQHQLRKAVHAISMAEQHLKQAVDKHRIAHEAGEAAAVKASPARVLETVGTMMKHYQTIAVCVVPSSVVVRGVNLTLHITSQVSGDDLVQYDVTGYQASAQAVIVWGLHFAVFVLYCKLRKLPAATTYAQQTPHCPFPTALTHNTSALHHHQEEHQAVCSEAACNLLSPPLLYGAPSPV